MTHNTNRSSKRTTKTPTTQQITEPIERLLLRLKHASDDAIYSAIVRCCHSAINDQHIRILCKYFAGLQYHDADTLYSDDQGHNEAFYFLGFEDRVDSVFFGIERDAINDYTFRIVSIRKWWFPFWSQHELIFAIDDLQFDYDRDESIFFKGKRLSPYIKTYPKGGQ